VIARTYPEEVDMKELMYAIGAAVLTFVATTSFAGFVESLRT